MNKNKLNGHFDECLFEIQQVLKQDGLDDKEIRIRCLEQALKKGFSPEQVVIMMQVGAQFKNGKPISLCVISCFAGQFLDQYFSAEELTDAVERIIRVSRRDRFVFEGIKPSHVCDVMKKAIIIARQHNLRSIDELVCFIENRCDEVVDSIQHDNFATVECCSDVEEHSDEIDIISFVDYRNQELAAAAQEDKEEQKG